MPDTPDRSDTWLIWRVDAVGGTTYWERDSEAEARTLSSDLAAAVAGAGLAGKVLVERGRVPDLDWEPGEGDGRV